MGKALFGTHATPSSLRLLDEVRSLRARVAELEQALASAEAAQVDRAQVEREGVDDGSVVRRTDAREPASL